MRKAVVDLIFVIPEISYRESGFIITRFPLKTCGNDKQLGFSDEPVMSLGLTKEDENHPSPYSSPLRGEGQGEGVTRLFSSEDRNNYRH